MPKTKAQKQAILQDLAGSATKQTSMVFVGYKGMKVKDLSLLRNQLKSSGAKLQVIKKTLFQKALKETGIPANLKALGDQIAAVFSFEDAFAPIAILAKFAKGNERLKILGGYVEKQLQDAASMKAIALLPTKDQLLARLAWTIAYPMSGFANVLQGNIKGLIMALNAIQNKK